MSVGNVTDTALDLVSLKSRFKAFQSGKENISKDDITKLLSGLDGTGIKVPGAIQQVQTDFDKIDVNGDGISIAELASYAGNSQESSGSPLAISKDELVTLQDQLAAAGQQAPKELSPLIKNFASVDTNQDDQIDLSEFKVFAQEGGSGLLASNKSAKSSRRGKHKRHGLNAPDLSKAQTDNGLLATASSSIKGIVEGAIQKYSEVASLNPASFGPAALLKKIIA